MTTTEGRIRSPQATDAPFGAPTPRNADGVTRLASYLPRITLEWLTSDVSVRHRAVPGTMVFADVSGFTKLSERLARQGKVGAEELSDLIGRCFAHLLADAYTDGGSLLKFGGDALLLLFQGERHAARACRAAAGMRRALREIGRISAGGGTVTLRMSVGVHSDTFDFYLVGESHRELVVSGPAATSVVEMEAAANAGQILLSDATAGLLDTTTIGERLGPGLLLRRTPAAGLSPGAGAFAQRPSSRLLESCLPPAVRARLSDADDASHRRATVAFLHFDGVDALRVGSGPGAVADRLHGLVTVVQSACGRYGVTFLGTDVDRDGGKIILVAGAPTTSEHDAERMLLSCREIVDRADMLPLRVGVNTGHVFAGDVGPAYRRTYTAMGDTVNLTARLMAKAEPGQIVVSPATLEASRTRFATTTLDPFMVKGKSRPVTASVLGVADSNEPVVVDDLATPLVGREAEVRHMRRMLDAARTRRGQLLEFVGDAGIGKSRLVTELRTLAGGMTVRSALCEEFEAGTPYFVFRHVLTGLLGLPADGTARSNGKRLLDLVRKQAQVVEPWTPLVAEVIGAKVPITDAARDLDPQFRRSRLAGAVIDLVQAVITTPTVLVVEDTHWMDEASAELLERLVAIVADLPLMVCTTRRDVATGFQAPSAEGVLTLRPSPLDAGLAEQLIDAMSEDAPLSPHDVALLVSRADGNPLYLRELVAAARSGIAIEDLPGSIEAVIVSRIDQLDPAERALLRRLSVIGSTFELDLAAHVLGVDMGPRTATWRSLRTFLTSDVPGLARFRHALVRDAAYAGLPYRVRRSLHQQVAQAIESTSVTDMSEQAGLLSLHYFHAHDYRKAWHYSRLAADNARAIYANVEAAELYERAIASGRRNASIPPVQLVGVYESLGDVRRRLGNYAQATEAFAAARRLVASDPVTAARLLLKTGRLRQVAGRYTDALRWLDRADKVLGGNGSDEVAAQRAQIAVATAAVRYDQGRSHDVIAWAERAIADARRANDSDALAHAYYLLDAANVALGRLDAAVHSLHALELYEELGDLWGQGVVLNNLGCYAYWRGRWNEAVTLYHRGRAARERIGDLVNASYGTINIAEILSDQGRLQEAEPLLRQVLRVWRAAGDRASIAYALGHLGRVLTRSKRHDEALSLLDEALTLSRDVGRQSDAIELRGRIGECRMMAGDARGALDELDQAVAQVRSVPGAGVHLAMLHRMRGFALLQLSRPDDAVVALETSLNAARGRSLDYEVALTLRRLSAVLAASGHVATAMVDESAAILRRLGVVRVFEPPHVVQPASVFVPAQSTAAARPLEAL